LCYYPADCTATPLVSPNRKTKKRRFSKSMKPHSRACVNVARRMCLPTGEIHGRSRVRVRVRERVRVRVWRLGLEGQG
jgi:hypothetical protein